MMKLTVRKLDRCDGRGSCHQYGTQRICEVVSVRLARHIRVFSIYFSSAMWLSLAKKFNNSCMEMKLYLII